MANLKKKIDAPTTPTDYKKIRAAQRHAARAARLKVKFMKRRSRGYLTADQRRREKRQDRRDAAMIQAARLASDSPEVPVVVDGSIVRVATSEEAGLA